MGENRKVIEIKKRELRKELNKRNFNRNKINRLKKSIQRHKSIANSIKRQRRKSKSRH